MAGGAVTEPNLSELLALLKDAHERVWLASPFITYPIAAKLAAIASGSSATWSLLTSLAPTSVANGFLSTKGLRVLRESGVEIRTIDRLHAKAYIADSRGLVGSANLTRPGLQSAPASNHELAVVLGPEASGEAAKALDAWWQCASDVGPLELDAADAAAAALPVPTAPPVIGDEEGKQPEVARLLQEARGSGLWIKAIYGDDEGGLWTDGEVIASSRKGRPKFAVGDLVLMYLRDHHVINGAVEVRSEARLRPKELVVEHGYAREEADRWPWVNEVRGRLWVPKASGVALSDLGVSPNGLQNGHVSLGLSEFAAAVRALAAVAEE